MRRLAVLLATLALPAVAAPPAAQAACTQASARPGPGLHTITARCDGRTTRIRRPRSSRVVGVIAAHAGGDWIAWSETYQRGGASVARVLRARRTAPRRVRRVWTSRLDVPTRVLTSSRGEVAFTTSRGLRLALPGRRARLVARDAGGDVLLDDDRTLRFSDPDTGAVRFLELPRPAAAGCPARRAFAPVLQTPELTVTVADWRDAEQDEGAIVTRACLTASGADPVIAQGVLTAERDEDAVPFAADRTWVLLARRDRRRAGDRAVVEALDARDGRVARRATVSAGDLPPAPRRPADAVPAAVTDAGAPAWLTTAGGTARLLAVTAAGALAELDRGPAGSITALRAEGGVLRWSGPTGPREAAP